jgi:hypothetical protein
VNKGKDSLFFFFAFSFVFWFFFKKKKEKVSTVYRIGWIVGLWGPSPSGEVLRATFKCGFPDRFGP